MTTLYRLEIYKHRINIFIQKTWMIWAYQYIFSEWGTTTHTVDWYLMAYTEAGGYAYNLKEQIYDYTV